MSEDRDPNQISLGVGLSSQVHRRIQMCPQSDHSWKHESLRQEVNKGARKHSPPGRIAFDVTDPPLAVLLAVHHDQLSLAERQLVWTVRCTVVDGPHPLRPLLRKCSSGFAGWRRRIMGGYDRTTLFFQRNRACRSLRRRRNPRCCRRRDRGFGSWRSSVLVAGWEERNFMLGW